LNCLGSTGQECLETAKKGRRPQKVDIEDSSESVRKGIQGAVRDLKTVFFGASGGRKRRINFAKKKRSSLTLSEKGNKKH